MTMIIHSAGAIDGLAHETFIMVLSNMSYLGIQWLQSYVY